MGIENYQFLDKDTYHSHSRIFSLLKEIVSKRSELGLRQQTKNCSSLRGKKVTYCIVFTLKFRLRAYLCNLKHEYLGELIKYHQIGYQALLTEFIKCENSNYRITQLITDRIVNPLLRFEAIHRFTHNFREQQEYLKILHHTSLKVSFNFYLIIFCCTNVECIRLLRIKYERCSQKYVQRNNTLYVVRSYEYNQILAISDELCPMFSTDCR